LSVFGFTKINGRRDKNFINQEGGQILGKSKQRIIARAKNDRSQINFTRKEALARVIDDLSHNPASISAKNMITLFGLSAEELSEAGLSYEVLRSLDCLISNFCSYNYNQPIK